MGSRSTWTVAPRPTGCDLFADKARRGFGELERVGLSQVRRVATRLDPRGETELVEDVRELPGGGLDHLDVAVRRLAELILLQRVREAGHGRQRRPQVVTSE